MLAVVEDDQHPAPAAVLHEPLDRVSDAVGGGADGLDAGTVQHGLAGADGGQHGLRYGVRVVHGGQLRQPHPVPDGVPYGLGGLLGQPGLAGSAGPEQGDEPGRREVGTDGRDVGLTADEGGEPGGQVAGHRRGGGCRRPGGIGQQPGVQRAQFGSRVGAEPVREELSYVLVGGQV